MDDDFMRCLFKDNVPLAEMVLRIITGKPDLVITDCQTQKDMKRLAGARSICLDAYGTDSIGKKYDMEIQREDKGADPHRARFHSSVLDIENLDAGQEFRELPDTYTIISLTPFGFSFKYLVRSAISLKFISSASVQLKSCISFPMSESPRYSPFT